MRSTTCTTLGCGDRAPVSVTGRPYCYPCAIVICTERATAAGQAQLPVPPRGFRHVPKFIGYAVSRNGVVKSCRASSGLRGKLIFGTTWQTVRQIPSHGYRTVHISLLGRPRATVGVHVLVLLAYRGPCPRGKEGCHNNGKHADNRLTNLRWDTRTGNLLDRTKHGYVQRSENKNAKLTPAAVRDIRTSKLTHVALAKRYGVHWKTISRTRHFKQWKRV
jgi:hypothetical protein